MDPVDVVAVVGACSPDRAQFAREAALTTGRMLIGAQRLAGAPDPVLEGMALAPWCSRPQGGLLELPAHADVTELIGASACPGSTVSLSAVVCVVDAAHLLDDLAREDCVLLPSQPFQPWRHTARSLLAVLNLEFASAVVLVNWESMSTLQLSTLLALLNSLTPSARLQLHHDSSDAWMQEALTGGTVYDAAQERAGWIALLNDEHDPYMRDPRVSAVHYENVRPLHPGRLQHVLDHRWETGEFGTVLRSAGFCRLATRPGTVARWNHVGRMICLAPLARDAELGEEDELLALGQDLGIIGLDLDVPALTAALDEVAVTDEELGAGPGEWARFVDPFPAWPTVSKSTD